MLTKLTVGPQFRILSLVVATGHLAWGACVAPNIQTNTASSQVASGGPVACVITNLYGSGGIQLANPSFAGVFQNSSLANLTPLSSAIGAQLGLLPLASSASGFTYTFDKAAGVYTRSSETFGPILGERAETIGRKKLFVAFSYQRYEFNTIDNLDVRNFSTVLTQTVTSFAPTNDVITTATAVDLKINQSTLFATYGATNWLDLSVAIPFEDVSINATSNATIVRTSGAVTNYFDPANITSSVQQKYFTNSSSASGIGDVTLRVKGTVWKNDAIAIALAADFRLPTGDETNYLGSGAFGFKPFVIASLRKGRVSPHVNIGYQKNGSSILAGNISTNVKASLPDQFIWTVGADTRVMKRLTLALDVLGQRVFDASRLQSTTFTTNSGTTSSGVVLKPAMTFGSVTEVTQSYNAISGSAGVKVNLGGNFLATANLLIKLNDGGLRANLSPLFGVSYTF